MKEDNPKLRDNIDHQKVKAFEAGFRAAYSGGYPELALRNAQLQFMIEEAKALAETAKLSKTKVK